MKVTIAPSRANGTVLAPPSKSMAHRMLMGAGLAEGTSVVENIDLSEDIKATLGMLKALGGQYKIEGHKVIMQGVGGKKLQTNQKLNSNESGSTLRFFIPLLLSGGEKAEFTGAKRLLERPLGIYEEICKEQGILFEKSDTGLKVEGQLKASHFKVQGNISSQFITGLLFALPLLKEDSVLEVLPPVESRAYIDMTLEALQTFGIKVRQEGNTFYIAGNQSYQAKDVTVEGDYSNAAFLDAFNLIGGNVNVTGLREDTLQGDRIYKSYYEVLKEEYPVMDLAECPDLGPILMGMAAAGNGAQFTGTRRLRIKESDRGAVMAEELAKFGIQVDVMENEIVVHKGTLVRPNELLNSHNDHRIAMTMATLCTITGGTIDGAESVRKSFPNYYDVIEQLGINVTREV
ncbi:MAG: 3-phosphoshikimate 1-carboxyvinyltransferase [Lachnospiraceae bacterium]|nr:3-phosphoshikimate 1-carboxyvinyltransferase [Lachnospiraceae bacterium]